MRRSAGTVLVMLAVSGPLVAAAVTVAAANPDVDDGVSFVACDADTAARMRFIEERLASDQCHGRLWWGGWLTFYAANVVSGSVQAAFEDDGGQRANYVVDAVKSLTGTTQQLLVRPTARLGADPLVAMPLDDQQQCRARLARGEELLRAAAAEANKRYDWRIHVGTVFFNVAGGVIVAEGFDEPDGWQSAGLGILLGEIAHWSHPWRARSDFEEYEQRFPADGLPRAAAVSWGVAPAVGGVALHVRF